MDLNLTKVWDYLLDLSAVFNPMLWVGLPTISKQRLFITKGKTALEKTSTFDDCCLYCDYYTAWRNSAVSNTLKSSVL